MKPAPFAYFAPRSLAEALSIMAELGDEAKLLAGGQSLVPAMNFRLVQPAALVDLNQVAELDYIRAHGDGSVAIGAMTRQRRLERDGEIGRRLPLLRSVMAHIAHPQIRNRGTLGGSLAHADPAAELPAVMLALDASLRLANRRRQREVAAADFFLGVFSTELEADEVLLEVTVPPADGRMGWEFIEFARRHGDYALLGLVALLKLDDAGQVATARLVYLNAGEAPLDAAQAASSLIGQRPDKAAFRQAAEIAVADEIRPTASIHASVEYLRHLGQVLTVRALTAAAVRAAA
ncbi:MAG: FAD binding domain-containing protein [Candidatus Promineifilaceae bacterium]